MVIPIHLAELCKQQGTLDIFSVDWKDTHVVLPGLLKTNAEDILLTKRIEAEEKLPVKKLFRRLPLALLRFAGSDNRVEEVIGRIGSSQG
jgi:maltooligosyltrehalose synthase